MSQLDALRDMTVVVADTGDIDAIKQYQPQDATTNPSLILSASALPQYAQLIDEAVAYAKTKGEPNQTSGKQELYEAILNMYC